MSETLRDGIVRGFLALFGLIFAACVLTWFVLIYGTLPVVLAEDADVCPDGSVLGGIDTCVNYTNAYDGGPCHGGTMRYPCACVEGYTPYATKFYIWSEFYYFRCCSGGDGTSSQCGTRTYIDVAAGMLMGLGSLGFLACNILIYFAPRARVVPLRPEDKEIEAATTQLDGEWLHKNVEMKKWAVSKDDLLQFRRLVMHAIRDGRITPTERDHFDPRDFTQGPSMYTVTEQYIKPVTRNVGSPSWALMKHPEGLECDLFITHGWAEGVFEFVDKVISSWPMEATGAYVCFLSNPQNLDIGGLIASPQESPFAKSLASAKQMLVIPNLKGSIYTRIWCVYEAYLAYTWKKRIYTAQAPVPYFWLKIARVILFTAAVTGVAVLVVSQIPAQSNPPVQMTQNILFYCALVVLLSLRCFFKTKHHEWPIVPVCIYFVATLGVFSRAMLSYRKSFKRSNSTSFFVFLALFAAGVEADRLLAVEGAKQRKQLKTGFAGIKEAQSANPADKERILAEIADGGVEHEVNRAVDVLLEMNLSVPETREVMENAGSLGDVSKWSRTMLAISLLWWITNPNQVWLGRVMEVYEPQETPQTLRYAVFALVVVESILFLGLFFRMPPERKAFAEKTLWIILLFSILSFTKLWHGIEYELGYTFVANPLVLALSIAGPARVSRAPLGLRLVRILFGRNPFATREVPRQAQDPKNPEEKDEKAKAESIPVDPTEAYDGKPKVSQAEKVEKSLLVDGALEAHVLEQMLEEYNTIAL